MNLTPKQGEVVSFLSEEPRTTFEISEEFSISESQARTHIMNIRNSGVEIDYDNSDSKYVLETDIEEIPEAREEVDIEEVAEDLHEGLTFEDFEEKYSRKQDGALSIMEQLRKKGYNIDHKEINEYGKRLFFIPDEEDRQYHIGDGDGTYRFGLMSDTHLGSSAEHLEELHDYYDKLQERGITTVFHAGDISDGWKVHKGHINVIKGEASGWNRLKDYVIDNYPKREGINTFFIEGNHDNKYHRRNGIHLGELIGRERDDLHYCGDSLARFVFDEENDIDIELIHPAGGQPYCYSKDTKVLVRGYGFVRFDEIPELIQHDSDIEIASYNMETGEMEFEGPEEFYVIPNQEKMVQFEGQSVDMLVTPNHRMLTRKNGSRHGTQGNWELVEAREMAENYVRQKWDIPRAASWSGIDQDRFVLEPEHSNGKGINCSMEDFCEFLGWYISEGSTYEPYGRIHIAQSSDGEKISEIVDVCQRIGLNGLDNERGKIVSTNKVLQEWLDENVGIGAQNKRIPERIKNLPSDKISTLLDSLYKGDGGATSSEQLAHDMVECEIKAGRSATVNNRVRNHEWREYQFDSETYEISTSDTKKGKTPSLCKQPKIVDYNDTAYCFKMPNKTLLTMRNGKTAFSGNSVGYRLQTLYRERPADQRPTIAAVGHLHGSMFVETEGVKGFYTGCWKGLTTWGKRKGHNSSIGGWIIEMEIEDGEIRKLVPEWVCYDSDDDTNNFNMEDVNNLISGE